MVEYNDILKNLEIARFSRYIFFKIQICGGTGNLNVFLITYDCGQNSMSDSSKVHLSKIFSLPLHCQKKRPRIMTKSGFISTPSIEPFNPFTSLPLRTISTQYHPSPVPHHHEMAGVPAVDSSSSFGREDPCDYRGSSPRTDPDRVRKVSLLLKRGLLLRKNLTQNASLLNRFLLFGLSPRILFTPFSIP